MYHSRARSRCPHDDPTATASVTDPMAVANINSHARLHLVLVAVDRRAALAGHTAQLGAAAACRTDAPAVPDGDRPAVGIDARPRAGRQRPTSTRREPPPRSLRPCPMRARAVLD